MRMRLLTSLLLMLLTAASGAQTVSTIAGPIDAAGGMSLGPDGNLYIGNFGDFLTTAGGNEVWKVTPSGETSLFAQGFFGATGNGWDSEGHFYQADIGASVVWKIDPNGSKFVFASGLNNPVGLAIDGKDNVYVTSCALGLINRITPEGNVSLFAESEALLCPNGLTIDPAGNLYTANFSDGGVFKIDRAGRVIEIARTPGSTIRPEGGNGHIAYARGRLYVASNATDQIFEIRADGHLGVLAGDGTRGHADGRADVASFSFPNGIAVSHDQRILYVNESVSTDLINPFFFPLTPNFVRAITLSPPFEGAAR